MSGDDSEMMNGQAVSWERLNAYVDGELAPAEAASVASAVAHDSGLARRVATLAALKANVAGLSEDTAPPFAISARGTKTRGSARRLAAIAATLALVAGMGSAIWFATSGPRSEDMSDALMAHRPWLAGGEAPATAALSVELAGARSTALPDLSAASLRLVRLDVKPGLARNGEVFAGYEGPNGCRVGLWVSPEPSTSAAEPVRSTEDGISIRAWRNGDIGYAMVGVGIDEARLDLIAALAAMSLRNDGPASQQIAALNDIRTTGRPCTA
jgi:anti-sigma factor RsiW